MKTITVTVEIDVPDNATDNDIADFVDVEYGECGKMALDNPCRTDGAEILDVRWEHGPDYAGRLNSNQTQTKTCVLVCQK